MAIETMTAHTPWVGLPHPDWPHQQEAPQEEAPTWEDYGAISDAIDRGDPAGFEALMALYHGDILNPTCLEVDLPETHAGCVLDPERPLAFLGTCWEPPTLTMEQRRELGRQVARCLR